MMTVDTENKQW